jgi:RHS repeat-associated protein/uncharacterized repeat protein (TIGR01451 family)
VSQTGPSGTGYYDFDASGNTVGITGAGSGYVSEDSYLPFGETTAISAALPNWFTFVGRFGVLQIGSNLLDMRLRDYTPATGQFLSNDPTRFGGGDTNLRRYAHANPTNLIDPAGLHNCACKESDVKVGGDQDTRACAMQGVPPSELEWIEQLEPPEQSPNNTYKEPTAKKSSSLLPPNPCPDSNDPFDQLPPGPSPFLPENPDPDPRNWVDPLGPPEADPENVISNDPNALVGPAGFGTQGFLQPGGTWSYTVGFENDGSAAAQDVTVTEQLDANLDWSTFQLGSFGFGPVNVAIPAGLTQYQTTVNYRNTDGSPLDVRVEFSFNVQTGLLTATFTSLDPATGEAPAGVFDGFLPPDDNSVVGEGFVQYTVQPKAGLASGAAITQQAAVVFDTNAPLNTAPFVNTIDTADPTSNVQALPAVTPTPTFTVTWSCSNDPGGSGIAGYDVFVSDNGGPFTPLQTRTTATSAVFTGQFGHTYGFYSVATDNVGHRQATPAGAEATTTIEVPASVQFAAANFSVAENGGRAVITITRTGGTDGTVTVQYASTDGTARAGTDYTAISGTLTFGPGETSKTITLTPLDNGLVTPDGLTVNLTLSQPNGAALGNPATAVLTVQDADLPIVPDGPPPARLMDAAKAFASTT